MQDKQIGSVLSEMHPPGWTISLTVIVLAALTVLACRISPPAAQPTPTPSPERRATLQAMATEQAMLRAELAALTGRNAHMATQVAAQATQLAARPTTACCDQVARQEKTISYLATRVSALARDADLTGPTPYPTPTPYRPVTGSVLLETGRCCAGGIAGETITVTAALEAESPVALVTEMRVRAGTTVADEDAMAAAAWEPYVAQKDFPVEVFVNWTGFYVNIQFRDAEGNLSPVVYDDISIEGEPAPPTPTP